MKNTPLSGWQGFVFCENAMAVELYEGAGLRRAAFLPERGWGSPRKGGLFSKIINRTPLDFFMEAWYNLAN